jgi:hypothetical protein
MPGTVGMLSILSSSSLQKRTISIPVLVLYFQQNKKVVRGEDREDREDKA